MVPVARRRHSADPDPPHEPPAVHDVRVHLRGLSPERAHARADPVLVLRDLDPAADAPARLAEPVQRPVHLRGHRDRALQRRLSVGRHPKRVASHFLRSVRSIASTRIELRQRHALCDPSASLAQLDSADGEPRCRAVQEHQPRDGDRRSRTHLRHAQGRERDVPVVRVLYLALSLVIMLAGARIAAHYRIPGVK
jgi:hypothetical protein